MNKDKKQDSQQLGVGKILIAEPFMEDGFFKKTVVLLTDYHDTGTVGFVLNKPMRINIKNLISDFPKFAGQVFMGGPVQNEMVHYLHTAGDILDGSTEVIPGVYWGGDFQQLKFLVSNGVIGPHDIRFFVGYSGWSPNQLEEEIEETKSWIVANGDPNYVFYADNIDLWTQTLSHKGKFLPKIAGFEDNINFN